MISELEPMISRDELLRLQKEDVFMMCARTYLDTGSKADINELGPLKRFRKQLCINDDGILCWKGKIVVPEQLHSYLLEVAHNHPTSGNFAEDRTWSNLTSKYFWPYARMMLLTGFEVVNPVTNSIQLFISIELLNTSRSRLDLTLRVMIWPCHSYQPISEVTSMR